MKINRTTFALTLLLFSVSLFLFTPVAFSGDFHEDSEKAKVTRNDHFELDARAIKSVEVETTNGGISITGSDDDIIIIDAEITVKGPNKAVCQELMDNVEIFTQEKDDKLNIEIKQQKKKKYSYSISFNLIVPRETDIEASTTNGGINITELKGNIEAVTVNGGVNCLEIEGDIIAGTVNGGINLVNVSGNVDAGTVNGGIECNAVNTPPSDIELGTVNGSIRLGIQGMLNTKLEATTMNGKVNVSGIEADRIQYEGKKKNPRHLNVIIGDGKGNYELASVNGSIHIEVDETIAK